MMKKRLVLSLALSCLMVLASLMLNSEAKAEYKTESNANYEKYLTYLDEKGVLGYDLQLSLETSPNILVNRDEVIMIISLSLGSKDVLRDTVFSDVSKHHHASGLIQSAY